FLDLALHGLPGRLAQLDHAAGQAPLAVRRRLATTHEHDARAVEHDGADPDAGNARVLPTVAHAGVASQSGLAYRSLTSRSTLAISSPERPPGRSVSPCSCSKACVSVSATSKKDGRRPSAASSVVSVASGSRVVGNSLRTVGSSMPSSTAPCCRNDS